MRKLLLEALIVAAAGALLAFAANGLSPRGLALGRNYFAYRLSTNLVPRTNAVAGNQGTNALSELDLLLARVREKGLHLVDSNVVTELYRDPRCEQGLVLFVDARDDSHYAAGHVPAAYQLDPYYYEKYLPVVLPACQMAEKILVYCNGGNCDDSLFAATILASALPKEKISIYAGGIHEWMTNNLPLEIGERKSGRLTRTNSAPLNASAALPGPAQNVPLAR